jgi:hypothetical protein
MVTLQILWLMGQPLACIRMKIGIKAACIVAIALLFTDGVRPELGLHFATEREVICSNSYIFVATVISAARSPIQCAGIGVSGVYCPKGELSPGFVDLSVTVTKVMGAKDVVTTFPEDAIITEGKIIPARTSHPALKGTVTSDEWKNDFVGREFIFGMQMGDGDVINLSDGKITKNKFYPDPPYWAQMYQMGKKDSIVKIVASGDGRSCPKQP